MATLTSTAAASGIPARHIHAGLQSKSVKFNAGATAMSDSATTVLMVKVPNKANVIDVIEYHTSGAATCPTDLGIGDDLSAFASGVTKGAVNRASTGVPYKVSLSDDATNQFVYVKATPTHGTSTTSFKCNLTVVYTMDSDDIS